MPRSKELIRRIDRIQARIRRAECANETSAGRAKDPTSEFNSRRLDVCIYAYFGFAGLVSTTFYPHEARSSYFWLAGTMIVWSAARFYEEWRILRDSCEPIDHLKAELKELIDS